MSDPCWPQTWYFPVVHERMSRATWVMVLGMGVAPSSAWAMPPNPEAAREEAMPSGSEITGATKGDEPASSTKRSQNENSSSDVEERPAKDVDGESTTPAEMRRALIPLDPDATRTNAKEFVPVTDALAPRSGQGMIIGGSLGLGIGLIGQLAGYALLHDSCNKLETEVVQDRNYDYAVTCGQGIAGGAALLFFSGILQLGGAPWVVAGMSERGRHRSFEDAFERHGRRSVTKKRARILVGVGGGLLGAGLALWVVSPLSAVSGCKQSPSLTCSVDATTWGWNGGLGLITTGASMMAYGAAYRRGYGTFRAIRNVEAAPMVLSSAPSGGGVVFDGGGMKLSGRF